MQALQYDDDATLDIKMPHALWGNSLKQHALLLRGGGNLAVSRALGLLVLRLLGGLTFSLASRLEMIRYELHVVMESRLPRAHSEYIDL